MAPVLCMRLWTALFAFCSLATAAHAARAPFEEYEISQSHETTEETGDGLSSGRSSGRDVLLERVIGVRDDGVELEYDLPRSAPPQERAPFWQLPMRVLKPTRGPMQVLNAAELEARLDKWLEAFGLTRADCGRWVFTWNAFRVECDPNSMLSWIGTFDLRHPDIYEGASYADPEAIGSGRLVRAADGPKGQTFTVVLQADPDVFRRGRAAGDVVAGEILRKPVTLEAALRERAKEEVSGTIAVTFDTDPVGKVWRRRKVARFAIVGPDGQVERRTWAVTVERRPTAGEVALPSREVATP